MLSTNLDWFQLTALTLMWNACWVVKRGGEKGKFGLAMFNLCNLTFCNFIGTQLSHKSRRICVCVAYIVKHSQKGLREHTDSFILYSFYVHGRNKDSLKCLYLVRFIKHDNQKVYMEFHSETKPYMNWKKVQECCSLVHDMWNLCSFESFECSW
jgi:hypothetical protein